jgi:CTP-dependent riboflavin kinase
VRLHESGIAESISVSDAVDVLNASPEALARWIQTLKEKGRIQLTKSDNEFLLKLSDETLEEERQRSQGRGD